MLNSIVDFNHLGYATFPVWAKDTAGHKAKTPAVNTWKNRKPEEMSFGIQEEKLYLKAGAFGVVLQEDDLVIDIDPRNFKPGDNPFKRLKTDLGIEIKAPTVKTGGGGLHLYFKKPKNIKCVSKLEEYPGIDFKSGPGAYVIGPLSEHTSGQKYVVLKGHEFTSIPTIPEKLLLALKKSVKISQGKNIEGTESDYINYCAWLENFPPAIEGENGDHQTYKAAVRGRDYGLLESDTFKAIKEIYNPKCKPQWSDEELISKVKNAYKYASGQMGAATPKAIFKEIDEKESDWDSEQDHERAWDLDQHGQPKKTLRNAVNYFYLWPELKNTVKYNLFTYDLEVDKTLPWRDGRYTSKIWTDVDIVLLKYYLAKKLRGLEFSIEILWEAIFTVGRKYAYHPVCEYVKSIKWDGKNRLDTWLSDYCGAQENAYVSAVGRKILIGMVARVFSPGVKFDYCLILEGKQGIGKSTVCAILGGEWYGDIILDPHGRDTIDALRGKWVIELSEMEVTKRADAQALKAFISRTTDRARLAYARAALDYPRKCVFIGTINPDELGYLSDTTGNRRFWPVKCGDKIDTDGLAEVRDQLIAEAYVAFNKKESFYLSGSLAQLAEIEQTSRMHVDPWQDVIAEWIETEGKEVTEINVSQIYEHVLGGQMKNISRSDQCRIGRILCNLGWHKWRPLRGGSRVYVYQRVKNEGVFS